MLVVPYFEPEVTHHSVFVIYLHSLTVFKTLLVMFLHHVCIVCFYESVYIFQVIYIKKQAIYQIQFYILIIYYPKVNSIQELFVFQTKIYTFHKLICRLCCLSFLSSPQE